MQKADKYKVTLNKNGLTDHHNSHVNLHAFYREDHQRLKNPDVTKMDKVPSWSNYNEIMKGNNSIGNHDTQNRMHISSIYHQMPLHNNESRFPVNDQPMEYYTSPSAHERYERYSDIHANSLEFYPSNPPPPPKRNLYNVNRLRQLQFVTNSFHRNSDKDWDSGYHSASNHIKLEESNPYETAPQQREGEIAIIHNANYKHHTETLNSWKPSTFYTESSHLEYQSQVIVDDRDDYAISHRRNEALFHYNLYQNYPTSDTADRPLHHNT